jgi:hypothetical protein
MYRGGGRPSGYLLLDLIDLEAMHAGAYGERSESRLSREATLEDVRPRDDAAFLQMIWAVDALQSGREAVAKPYFSTYPPEAAAKSSIQSPFGIHRWELETLIVQLFLVPKEVPREQGNLVLHCSQFESTRQTINRLRALENVEYAR